MLNKRFIGKLIIALMLSMIALIIASRISPFGNNKHIFDSPLIGKTLPEFALKNLLDENISNQTLLNDSSDIKIINFFASWCKGCWQEHELLKAIESNLDIPIYGFAWNDDLIKLTDFLNRHGNPYKQVMRINNATYLTTKLHLSYIPMSLIIDRNNKIIAHFQGQINANNFNYFLNQYNERPDSR